MSTLARPDRAFFMRQALRLARRGYGCTSPNPMVGAVLVKRGRIIGRGWHHRAGEPHAEIEALRDAERRGHAPRGATLYVTLEPCSTVGRTPACTDALIRARIARVIVAAADPNPRHAGRGFQILERAGIRVEHGLLAGAALELNAAFNHWIVCRIPWVTVKAAMTLDGKIATAAGESQWITGSASRAHAMQLRLGTDAILVGVNTVLADDPSLTVRREVRPAGPQVVDPPVACDVPLKPVRRLVLDAQARTPLTSKLVTDAWAAWTTVFVGRDAPLRRRQALARRVRVVVAPEVRGARGSGSAPRDKARDRRARAGRLDIAWILRRLGREGVTSLLVEGGGEVIASFFEAGMVQRVAFYYAPKVLGEALGRRAVGGQGFGAWPAVVRLRRPEWRRLGSDLLLTAAVETDPPNGQLLPEGTVGSETPPRRSRRSEA